MKRDPLLFNKIAGGVLLAVLVGYLGNWAGNSLVSKGASGHQSGDSSVAYSLTGDEVASAKDVASAAKKVVQSPIAEPVAALLAQADAVSGEKLFKRACASCHAITDANKVGPGMVGIVNRAVASAGGFRYSKAFRELSGAWDAERLNQFIANPRMYVRGTKMGYSGMRKVKDRADLITYLQSLSP